MNGHNDNPMAIQFISAYRKLLHQNDVMISKISNVSSLCTSNVLTVSSLSKRQNEHDLEMQPDEQEDEEWIDVLDLVSIDNCDYLTDSHNTGVAFIASMLEKRLTSGNIYCNMCKKVLIRNEKVNDRMCVSPQNGKPCVSTYQLCKLSDTALKTLINSGPNFKQKVYLSVMNRICFENIFPEFFDPEHDIDHKHFLIKFIIDEYVNKKCAYYAKQKTISLQKRYVRNKLKKIAHFMHL